MSTPFDNKIIKQKKLDKELTLKVLKNEMAGRIFVEFASQDGKLFLQKSFQSTTDGEREAAAFQKSFKSIKDLKKYFGLSNNKK